MKGYLGNKMTDVPQFNYPWFDRTAAMLREQGHEVQSPAEMDDPETRAAAMASPDGAPGTGVSNGETWGDFLARDVKLLADGGLDVMWVGPQWRDSKGTRLETFIAHLVGLPILYAETGQPVEAADLVSAWAGDLLTARLT